jgi:hypothetical protein
VGVGAGLAVAGLGLGVASVLLSNAKSSQAHDILQDLRAKNPESKSVCYQSGPADCARLDSAYVAAGSFRNLAILGFVTGGVAALATVTYALIPPAKGPAPAGQVRASVNVGPGTGRAFIQGRF